MSDQCAKGVRYALEVDQPAGFEASRIPIINRLRAAPSAFRAQRDVIQCFFDGRVARELLVTHADLVTDVRSLLTG
jgi:hypothetical protein